MEIAVYICRTALPSYVVGHRFKLVSLFVILFGIVNLPSPTQSSSKSKFGDT